MSRFPQIVEHGCIHVPLDNGARYHFTRDVCLRYQADFQDLDVVLEVMKLRRWCRMNPEKCVPREAVYGLITGWLKKADRDRKQRRTAEDDEHVRWQH